MMKKLLLIASFCVVLFSQTFADVNQALKLKDEGELDRAEKILISDILYDYTDGKALYALGVVKYRQSDFEQAKLYFKQAAALSDNDEDKEQALYNLSRAQAELKEYEDAIKVLEKVLEMSCKNDEARHNLEILRKLFEQQQQEKEQNQSQDDDHQDQSKDKNKDNQDQNDQGEQGEKSGGCKSDQDQENQEQAEQGEQGDDGESGQQAQAAGAGKQKDSYQKGDEKQELGGQDSEPEGSELEDSESEPFENNQLDESEKKSYQDNQCAKQQQEPRSQNAQQPEQDSQGQVEQEKQGAEDGSKCDAQQPDDPGQDEAENKESGHGKAEQGEQDHEAPFEDEQQISEAEDSITDNQMQNRYNIEQDDRFSETQKAIIERIEKNEAKTRKNLIRFMLNDMPSDVGGRSW